MASARARARSAASPGSNRRPTRSSSTISGQAPERAATTGVPAASDSTSTRPKASSSEGSTVAEALAVGGGELGGVPGDRDLDPGVRAAAERARVAREHQPSRPGLGDRSRSNAVGEQRAALARVVERRRAEQHRRRRALDRARVVGEHDAAGEDLPARRARSGAGARPRPPRGAHRGGAGDRRLQHLEPVPAADQVLAVQDAVDRERVRRAAEARRAQGALQPSTGYSAWASSKSPRTRAVKVAGIAPAYSSYQCIPGSAGTRRPRTTSERRPRARRCAGRGCVVSRVTSWPRAGERRGQVVSEPLGAPPDLGPVRRVKERDPH